jgi:hypothetical protein
LVKNNSKSLEKYKNFSPKICDQKVTKFSSKKNVRIFGGLRRYTKNSHIWCFFLQERIVKTAKSIKNKWMGAI